MLIAGYTRALCQNKAPIPFSVLIPGRYIYRVDHGRKKTYPLLIQTLSDMESVLNNIEYAKDKIIDKASKVDSKDLKEAGQLAALSLTAYYASIVCMIC